MRYNGAIQYKYTDYKMNCHYSCGSCSASTLMYKCLSCVATRQLIDNTCVCSSAYYEIQQSQCIPKENESAFQALVLPIAEGLYYTNIILFWIYVIATFCRVNSPKLRITINFGQIIALFLYYPYLYQQISKQFLSAISVLNFSYFFKLYTCSDSTTCKLLQYIWEPLLILPCLIVCFFISYFLMNLCYRYILRQPISIRKYWSLHWTFIIFFFIDLTAVILSYNITKAIFLSYVGFVFAAIYIIVLVIILIYFFRLINTDEQAKVLYRAKEGWAYGYDQNYHLYFIDYLYDQGRKVQKQQKQRKAQSLKPVQQKQQKQKGDIINKFTPHSNLYIFQIVFKILIGVTTVVLYEYKPVLIVFSLVLLMIIIVCWMGAFFYYDKSSLLLYLIMSVCTLICAATYWLSIYWLIAMIVSLTITGLMGGVFVILFFMNAKINDKIANRIFLDPQEEIVNPVAQNISQEELIKNKNQQQKQYPEFPHQQNLLTDQDNQENNRTNRQPFQGNLTRKTRISQTNQPITTPQNPQTAPLSQVLQQEPERPKGKSIFKMGEGQLSQNIIKPASHQAKLSQLMTKVAAKNRAKNVLQQPNEDKNQQNLNGNRQNQNGKNSRQNLNSKGTNKKKPLTARSKQQDLLSNIFEPKKEEQPSQIKQAERRNTAQPKDKNQQE